MDAIIGRPRVMQPGIYRLDEPEYHASAGASKSSLWTLINRTPFHARYGSKKETDAQKFGSAAHTAVLEPGLFEQRFYRGPADRRGNKWGAAQDIAAQTGRVCITEKEFDGALRIRDALSKNETVRRLTSGTPSIEQSAYWIDEETGELCRCRPDIYSHDMNVMADLKSTTDAKASVWWRRVKQFGYYVQDAYYRDGWEKAGGGKVDGFVFIAVEESEPHASAVYELEADDVELGRKVYREALNRWHACRVNEVWPGYGSGVLPLSMDRYAREAAERMLEDEDEEIAA